MHPSHQESSSGWLSLVGSVFGALILSITGRSVDHKTWASLRLPNRVYLKKDSHRQLQNRIILLPPRGCEWVNVSSGTNWLTWVVLDKGPLTGSVCVCSEKHPWSTCIHNMHMFLCICVAGPTTAGMCMTSGKSGLKDQVALHYYYTSPSHWCTTH